MANQANNPITALINAVNAGKKSITDSKGVKHMINEFSTREDDFGRYLRIPGKIEDMPLNYGLKLNKPADFDGEPTYYGLARVSHKVRMFEGSVKQARLWANSAKNWRAGDEIVVEISEFMTVDANGNRKVNASVSFAGDTRENFSFDFVDEDDETETLNKIANEMQNNNVEK